MGVEMSTAGQIPSDIAIPSSLRPIHPFLADAQKNLNNARKPGLNLPAVQSRKKIVVACISHAFKLLNILNLEWDEEGRVCLETFRAIRDQLSSELGQPIDPAAVLKEHEERPAFPSHDIIIAEADEALALAELQLQEGLKFDAMLNYHTSCVYYRVMESMLPGVASHVHQRLLYAAWRTRQCSDLANNFVREHFDGVSCADIYEVHGSSKLGKGSYGSVYLATHRLTCDERAVKVMNVDRVTSYYLRKLHTEIAILKTVDHPNIVKLQDVFFGKRSVYLVTDLCRGGELFELLNSGKNQGFVFREDRASRLMRDMISAVHYLHGKGVVHRDLKLENFLFEAKNSSSPLVLIDFGLSKHFENDEKMTHRVGSCYYTAPEVLAGSYDHRCDVWSLGVLCYMLLSGSPPFYGKTVEDVYKATQTQEAVFPDKKFRHLSSACMDFMRRLLVKDPNQRMTTAQALLHPFITGQGNISGQGGGILPPIAPTPAPSSLPSLGMNMNMNMGISMNMGFTPPAPPAGHGSGSGSGGGGGVSVPVFGVDTADQIVGSISIFMAADPLTKLAMELVAHTLCANQVLSLRVEFQAMDRQHVGTVSAEELGNALKVSRHPALLHGVIDLASAYEAMSIQRSSGKAGGLSFREYIAAAMCKRLAISEERVMMAFNSLDIEKTGYLTVEGMRLALGDDIPQAALEVMLHTAAKTAVSFIRGSEDGFDGRITWSVFCDLWNYAVASTQHTVGDHHHYSAANSSSSATDGASAEGMDTD